MSFTSLGIAEPILKALSAEGYTTPTPIQQQAIPILLRGRDLLASAQTGTGKTAAFAIPILQLLSAQPAPKGKHIRALIVTPTRELAIQIGESFNAYGRYTQIRNTVIFGGVKQHAQTEALRRGPEVLIATPGRLLDLIEQRYINLSNIEYFVLDEADRMLDMGFIHDVRRILKIIPKKRQSLFFSATMPPPIVKLSREILGDPESVVVKPEQTTAEKVRQELYHVGKASKPKLLIHLLQNRPEDAALVFTRTKHGANKVVKFLDKAGIGAMAIHGNKSQNARQEALKAFKDGKLHVLVATDIAARGIDVDELSLVFNYDLPNIPETYVHRIGRTGRANASGLAISFCDEEERPYLRDIEKFIRQELPVVKDHPFDSLPEPAVPVGTAKQFAGQRPQRPQRKPGSGNGSGGGGSKPKSKRSFRPKRKTSGGPSQG